MSESPPPASLPIPKWEFAPAPDAIVPNGPPASGLPADVTATNNAAPTQLLQVDQSSARTCVEVVTSQTDQAIYYATPIFTGNMPTLGQLGRTASAAINSVLLSDSHCIMRALPHSTYNPDTGDQVASGLAKFSSKPFDNVWEQRLFAPIIGSTLILTGGFGPNDIDTQFRVPLARGSPISLAVNQMSRLFQHGKTMEAAATTSFKMPPPRVFFAESGMKYERMNGEMWNGPVISIVGLEFPAFQFMVEDYIAVHKQAAHFRVSEDEGIQFRDVGLFGNGAFTPAAALLVQHVGFVASEFRAGDFSSGQPGGAVIRSIFGSACAMSKGGKGAQGKFKNSPICTLSIAATEFYIGDVVAKFRELVAKGTFQIKVDEWESNITFFSSEAAARAFAPSDKSNESSPAIKAELEEMKNQLKASLHEMSAQQSKTSAQVQDTAAEVQSLASELCEHDEKRWPPFSRRRRKQSRMSRRSKRMRRRRSSGWPALSTALCNSPCRCAPRTSAASWAPLLRLRPRSTPPCSPVNSRRRRKGGLRQKACCPMPLISPASRFLLRLRSYTLKAAIG